jgi:membrane protein required for colicin V production
VAIVDYVVVGIIATSALIGLARGFVREILSLVIWAVAVVVALTFSEQLALALPRRIEGDSLRFVAAFALIFVGVLIVGGLAQWLLKHLISTTGLSGTDRLFGLLFGGLRGAVVCIVAIIALRPIAAEQNWWHASRAVPVLEAFESQVTDAMATVVEWFNRIRQKR